MMIVNNFRAITFRDFRSLKEIENLYSREKKSAKINMRNVIPYYVRKQCGDFKC